MAKLETMIKDLENSRQNLIDVVCDSTMIPSVTLHSIEAIIKTTIFIEEMKRDQKKEAEIDGKIFSDALKNFDENMDCIVIIC